MKILTIEVWAAAVVVTTATGMVTGCGKGADNAESEPAASERYVSRAIELADAAGDAHKGVALTSRAAADRLDILLSSATAISRPQGAAAPYSQRLKQAQDMILAADPGSDVTAIVMEEDNLGWGGRLQGAQQQVDPTELKFQVGLAIFYLDTWTYALNQAYFSGTYMCNGADVSGYIIGLPTSTAIVTMSLMSDLPPNGTPIATKTDVKVDNGTSPLTIDKWCWSGDGTTGNCQPEQTAFYHVRQLQTNVGNNIPLITRSHLHCW